MQLSRNSASRRLKNGTVAAGKVLQEIFWLCLRFLSPTPSLIASLMFAVHPIHTEAVTGVVGRAELLSSIFFLAALLKYLESAAEVPANDYKVLGQSMLFAALAMFSKEQGITVSAVCVTYDIFLVRRDSPSPMMPDRAPRGKIKGPTPTWRKDLVLRLLLVSTATTILLTIRMQLMGSKLPVFNRFDNPAAASDWPVRQLTYQYVIALNAWLLLFPSDLCCDWTMGTVPLVTSLFDFRTFATAVFYISIFTLSWRGGSSGKSSKPIIMGMSLTVFPFLPVSNLLYPVGFVVAERVLYLPSMGFCMLVAHGWQLLHDNRNRRYWLRGILVIIMCLNATKTVYRNFDWKDEESLFRAGLRTTQHNAKLYNNLGHVMEAGGRHRDALRLFVQAARIQADDLGCHLNIGRMYNALGMTEEAEKAFWMAKTLLPKPSRDREARVAPRHLDVFLDLGRLLSRNISRLEEAQQLYKEAITMKSDYIDAYMHRASILLKLNRSREAYDMYKEALKHDNMNPDIFYNIGVLLLEQGKSVQALARFDQALRLDPAHEKSLLNYAILTQDSGDSNLRKLANERLQGLLEKGRQPARTYFNLGMLAMQDGRTDAAEQHFRSALQIRGDFDSALFNLGLVLYEQGRPLASVPYLLKLQGRHLKGLALLGNIYFSYLRNYTAAMQCYQRILQRDPAHVPALHNLCAAHFELGHLDEAERCLLRAQALAPGELHIEQHLAVVRQRQQELRAANHCSSAAGRCDSPRPILGSAVFVAKSGEMDVKL